MLKAIPPFKATSAKPGDYLVFLLNEQYFGIEILNVRAIHPINKIFPVPGEQPYLLGLGSYEGMILPIVDLKLKFSIPQLPPSPMRSSPNQSTIIIINGVDGPIGIAIDAVTDVTALAPNQITLPTGMESIFTNTYLIGVGNSDGQIILLLNMLDALRSINISDNMKSKAKQIMDNPKHAA